MVTPRSTLKSYARAKKTNGVARLRRYPSLAPQPADARRKAHNCKEVAMLSARNADVADIRVSAVEGKPTYGGELAVKPPDQGRGNDVP
jgi:hypothetical protein